MHISQNVGWKVNRNESSRASSKDGRCCARILIIEDEPGVAMAMRLVLGLANCEAQIAGTKKKATEMAESGNFDLITMDVKMPDANGFELCAEFKRNPRLRNIPIVFVSGQSNYDDEERGLAAGAVDYITKPFDSREFASRLLSHIITSATDV